MLKYETKFKKVFKKREDGLYQEIIRHFIVTTNKLNGEIKTQFDKEFYGKIYKKATVSDYGVNGCEEFYDENTNETIFLVAIQ